MNFQLQPTIVYKTRHCRIVHLANAHVTLKPQTWPRLGILPSVADSCYCWVNANATSG